MFQSVNIFDTKNEEFPNTPISDFLNKIRTIIQTLFPRSYLHVDFDTNLCPLISIRFALGKDKSEWSHGYIENDLVSVLLFIRPKDGKLNGNDDLKEKLLEITAHQNSFVIKPRENEKWLAYSSVKIPFRKQTGLSDKIVLSINKFFINLKQLLIENKDNIPEGFNLASKLN